MNLYMESTVGVEIVVQLVKAQFGMPIAHIQVPSSSLHTLDQLQVSAAHAAADEGSSTQVSATHVGNPNGILGSHFGLPNPSCCMHLGSESMGSPQLVSHTDP